MTNPYEKSSSSPIILRNGFSMYFKYFICFLIKPPETWAYNLASPVPRFSNSRSPPDNFYYFIVGFKIAVPQPFTPHNRPNQFHILESAIPMFNATFNGFPDSM